MQSKSSVPGGLRIVGLLAIGAWAALELAACSADDAGPEADAQTREDAGASTRDGQVAEPDSTAQDAGRTPPVDAGRSEPCPQGAGDGGCAPLDEPDASASGDAGDDSNVSCDARKVDCKRAPPDCPTGLLPEVVDTCWGDCVHADRCVCHSADECPQPDQYACHMSAAHCGPYVN